MNGTFSSTCRGDSGGPLTTKHEENCREDNKAQSPSGTCGNTLIGIVSGGVGCYTGIPAWFTKVGFTWNKRFF